MQKGLSSEDLLSQAMPTIGDSIWGFGCRAAERRYQQQVSGSSVSQAFVWSAFGGVFLAVLALEASVEEGGLSVQSQPLNFLYLGPVALVGLLLLYKPSFFPEHRVAIWLVTGACRVLCLLLACQHGWKFSCGWVHAFKLQPLVMVLQGLVEQMPFPYIACLALGHLLISPQFMLAMNLESSVGKAWLRSLWIVLCYVTAYLAKDWHARHTWMQAELLGSPSNPGSLCQEKKEEVQLVNGEFKGAADPAEPLEPDSARYAGKGKMQSDGQQLHGADLSGSNRTPDSCNGGWPSGSSVATPFADLCTPSLQMQPCSANQHSRASMLPLCFAPPSSHQHPSLNSKLPNDATLCSMSKAAPAAACITPPGVVTASTGATKSLQSPTQFRTSMGVQGGGRQAVYRRLGGLRRTCIRTKIMGFTPTDLPGDVAVRISTQLAGGGHLVVGMAIREGCIEIAIDLLNMQGPAARQRRVDALSQQQQQLLDPRSRQSQATTVVPAHTASGELCLGSADVMALLECLQLPFDGNEVSVQVDKGAPAKFKHDAVEQHWQLSADSIPVVGAAAVSPSPFAPLWVATPVAILNRGITSQSNHCLDLQIHVPTGTSPPPVAKISARVDDSFLPVTEGSDGSMQLQVPAAHAARNSLLQLESRTVVGGGVQMFVGSCGVLLLDDEAVVDELLEKLQSMLLAAVAVGDAELCEDLSAFVQDLGTVFQFYDNSGPIALLEGAQKQQFAGMVSSMVLDVLEFASAQGLIATAAAVERGMKIAPSAPLSVDAVGLLGLSAAAAEAAAVGATSAGALEPVPSPAPPTAGEDGSAAVAKIVVDAAAVARAAAKERALAHGADYDSCGSITRSTASASAGSSSSNYSSVCSGKEHVGAQWEGYEAGAGRSAGVPAPVMAWSMLLWGFPDQALERRYAAALHRARTQHLCLMSLFAVSLAIPEIVRVVWEQRSPIPGIPHTVYGGVNLAVLLLQMWRPATYEAYPGAWPLACWGAQSFVIFWYALGLPVRAGIAAMTLSRYCWIHHTVHQFLMALFKRVRVPLAVALYTGTAIMVAFCKLTFGAQFTVWQLFKQELPFWLVAVGYTAWQEYRTRAIILAQHAQLLKKHA